MTSLTPASAAAPAPHRHLTRAHPVDLDAVVEVVIPVHDEEVDLAPSVTRLEAFLRGHFPYSYGITIADNASTDGTWAEAERLCPALPRVRAVHLDQKGRGRALKAVWSRSANTAANRRMTFGLRGSDGALRHTVVKLVRDYRYVGGLLALGVGLGLTSGSLGLLHHHGDPGRAVEVAVLVVADTAATLVRFLALRQLMAHRR